MVGRLADPRNIIRSARSSSTRPLRRRRNDHCAMAVGRAGHRVSAGPLACPAVVAKELKDQRGPMSTLSGKWALVTGATAGLGLAVAESLAAAGANLVVHDLAAPRDVADDPQIPLRRRHDRHRRRPVAARRHRSHDGRLLARLDGIDILVNNAVVRHFSPVENFSPERWDEALAVNLSAPFHLVASCFASHEAARLWPDHQHGLDLFDAAVAERIDYVTTKTAIIGMTRAVAIETATTESPAMRCARARCRRRPSRRRSHDRGRTGWPLHRRGDAANIWRPVSRADGSSPPKASAP